MPWWSYGPRSGSRTGALRRALAARDRGCAHPGCPAPPPWCDAHHIRYWSRGGPTVIDNLVLLCARHHTEIHCEEWRIDITDGVPWFTPPRHIDPAQQPLRNTVHTPARDITTLAQTLWTDDDPDPPDDG